jgi:hypothetical protein
VEAPPPSVEGVADCLISSGSRLENTTSCVAAPESTDDEVLAKAACLGTFDINAEIKCGPRARATVISERATRLDLARHKARLATKAAPIITRRERVAAIENARIAKEEAQAEAKRKLCRGPNVMAILAATITGQDVDPKKLRTCEYLAIPGRVATTTRDGWVIVTWGPLCQGSCRHQHA